MLLSSPFLSYLTTKCCKKFRFSSHSSRLTLGSKTLTVGGKSPPSVNVNPVTSLVSLSKTFMFLIEWLTKPQRKCLIVRHTSRLQKPRWTGILLLTLVSVTLPCDSLQRGKIFLTQSTITTPTTPLSAYFFNLIEDNIKIRDYHQRQ